jgi:2-oxoglutarate dehydrogenase E2 component (dihydrolipoamide succinyltransferase)
MPHRHHAPEHQRCFHSTIIMAIELKVPAVGESISEVEIGSWLKAEGDAVKEGETLVVIETEKATVDLPSPAAGVMGKILKPQGSVAAVGEIIGSIEAGATAVAQPPSAVPVQQAPLPAETKSAEPKVMPAAERVLAEAKVSAAEVTGTGPGGRVLKEDAVKAVEAKKAPAAPAAPAPKLAAPVSAPPNGAFRQEQAVRMTKLRRTVATRLVAAQHNAALLTTFNEVDMSAVMAFRKEHGEAFLKRHGAKLGFMSFFVKAVIDGLKLVPQLNAEIRGEDIVYKNFQDIGVAIGGGKGLVVPVIRNAERLSFAEIEKAILDFGTRAKDGKILPDELEGGTFTISNGGVYGSMLSTPIVNPPQSGVLGMHNIIERPVALNGAVVIRPIMYVALTYDHRIVDGKEAVTFLKRVKDVVENPARMLLEV